MRSNIRDSNQSLLIRTAVTVQKTDRHLLRMDVFAGSACFMKDVCSEI